MKLWSSFTEKNYIYLIWFTFFIYGPIDEKNVEISFSTYICISTAFLKAEKQRMIWLVKLILLLNINVKKKQIISFDWKILK